MDQRISLTARRWLTVVRLLRPVRQLPQARLQGRLAVFRHTIVNTNYRVEVFGASIGGIPTGFRWLARKSIGDVPVSTTLKKALAAALSNKSGDKSL